MMLIRRLKEFYRDLYRRYVLGPKILKFIKKNRDKKGFISVTQLLYSIKENQYKELIMLILDWKKLNKIKLVYQGKIGEKTFYASSATNLRNQCGDLENLTKYHVGLILLRDL